MKENNFEKNVNTKEVSMNEQIISKRKKTWLIVTIFMAICCVIFLVGVISCFASKERGLAFFALILFVSSSIFTIFFLYKYKTRSDSDWIIDHVQAKHLDSTQEGIELLKQANIISDSSFILSKRVDIFASKWFSSHILIDNQNKKFVYQKGEKYSKTYDFSDLIKYEVYENGKSQVQGRAGSALIGGAFFGLGGAIVGSSMSRNVNEKCNQLKLILRLKDFNYPEIEIKYVGNADLDKNSPVYKRMKNNIQSVCSMLEYILNENKLEPFSTAIKYEEKTPIKTSNKEQLQELKELLDNGLITQEDYEQKKKQILGL